MDSPTITSPATMTGVGIILGTAAYMSPEQAKGRTVDKRSDVWTFGAVLYEMLTARRAFEGDDISDTLARILMKEPDWTALPATVPAAMVTVIRRCLQKVRQRLPRHAEDRRRGRHRQVERLEDLGPDELPRMHGVPHPRLRLSCRGSRHSPPPPVRPPRCEMSGASCA